MGYDVTFHPVSLEEVQYFIFDMFDRPKLADERASVLTRNTEKRERVLALYKDLWQWRDVAAWEEERRFGRTVGYLTAALCGFLHPYWYARGGPISFMLPFDPRVRDLFRPWPEVGHGLVSRMPDSADGLLLTNYDASGFIVPAKIPTLELVVLDIGRRLVAGELDPQVEMTPYGPLIRGFSDEGLQGLLKAIEYAEKHGLGMMEACDVVIPIMDKGLPDPDQFRFPDLDNVDDLTNRREM